MGLALGPRNPLGVAPRHAIEPRHEVAPPDPGRRFESLWSVVDAVRAPLLLLRGARSSVVSDEDVAELLRRQGGAKVEMVPDAGHSIQGDEPVELACRLQRFLDV